MLKDSLISARTNLAAKARYAAVAALPVAMSCAYPLMAHAAESGVSSFDPTAVLVSSFENMATTILATIAATLPVVMSVMSAYICISFGMRFFRKFVK